MVDEVGLNLHYNYNNNLGRKSYILRASSDHITIRSNNNGCQFTILRFTSTDRQPIMYVLIKEAERLSYDQIQGIDISVPLVEHFNLIKELN